ncbi:hypothetical protein PCANC_20316 [Puccinia coronata f. sp. avenae]|uniref:Uncharacterized protein n=1 Tax=Puccinia coronata f. sp. avenae TaxID=200324 RepID=A0A2N5SDC1_9BASI|nr:hypothetical protein PCANC_20316 [Puccinia coronata f. sp. avenae]
MAPPQPSRLSAPNQSKSKGRKRPRREPTPHHHRTSPPESSAHPSDDEEDFDSNNNDREASDYDGGSNAARQRKQIDPEIDVLDERFREDHQDSPLPLATIPVNSNNPDGPAMSPEVVQKLRAMTILDDEHFNQAVDVLNTPGAPISFLVLKEMERLQIGDSSHKSNSNDDHTHRVNGEATKTKEFTFSTGLKDRIQDFTKQALLRSDIDAYTRGVYKPGTSDLSLLTITMKSLEKLPDDYRKDAFPPGYKDDPTARKALVSKVRDLQKRVRLSMREKLLQNIINADGDTIEDAVVPDLHMLMNSIIRFLHSDEVSMTEDEVEEKKTPLYCVRIGYMRLQTLHHLLNKPSFKQVSQWDLIDEKIHQLKTRDTDYRAAWGKAIISRDQLIFGHKRTFGELNKGDIRLPNENDVQAKLQEIHRKRAQVQASHASTSTRRSHAVGHS